MRIFVGSSTEQKSLMLEICRWVEAEGHKAERWDSPDMFLPGENTNVKLLEIARSVGAAVFVFGEDDSIWYRNDSRLKATRDNVVLEYGLFCGCLGFRNVAIVRHATPKMASDLNGVIYVNYHENSKNDAESRLKYWMRNLGKEEDDPAIVSLKAQLIAVKRQLDEVKDQLFFEKSASTELRSIITRELGAKNGEWIWLFDHDFYRLVIGSIEEYFARPSEWRSFLDTINLNSISEMIAWDRHDDPTRLRWFVIKIISTIRIYDRGELFARLMDRLPDQVVAKIRTSPITGKLLDNSSSTI